MRKIINPVKHVSPTPCKYYVVRNCSACLAYGSSMEFYSFTEDRDRNQSVRLCLKLKIQ